MKLLDIFSKPRETPMHLIASAPGKIRKFNNKHDFDAAVQACTERLIKKSGKPEPKLYWFDKKGQKKAVWDKLSLTGVIFGE